MYVGVGGAVYWGPDVFIQWARPPHRVWITLLTLGVPAIVALCWLALSKREPHRRHPTGLPLFMLLGIWALAPLGAAIGTVPTGGEFLQAGQLREFLMMWLAFPMTTTIMTTYSGSLGGVGLATLFLIVVSIVGGLRQRSNRRLQPAARSSG